MTDGTTTTVSRRVLAFDAALVATTVAVVALLATRLPIWASLPAGLVVATTAFALAVVAGAWVRVIAEDRAHAGERLVARREDLVGARAR